MASPSKDMVAAIHVGPPKSDAGFRTVPVPSVLIDTLVERLSANNLTDDDAWLFPAPMGGPLRYSWWWEKVWCRAREAIGMPQLGFHDLRRAYATLLVATGADVKVSQELMGHEDIRMTRGLYAQAGIEAKREVNEAVADRLMSAPPDTTEHSQT